MQILYKFIGMNIKDTYTIPKLPLFQYHVLFYVIACELFQNVLLSFLNSHQILLNYTSSPKFLLTYRDTAISG